MVSELVYQKMIEKVNKNHTNELLSLDRARAVMLFNEEANKFIEWTLQKKNSFVIEDIQHLLVSKSLEKFKISSNYTTFKFPKNFFSFVNVEIFANSSCGTKSLLGFRVKPEDVSEYLVDENNKPSLKFRETFYVIEDGGITIYTDNFDIDKVVLRYYRYPIAFNLDGYIQVDGSNSFSQDPEFSDRVIDRIISMCATSFDINNENVNKVQFDINRVNSKY